MTRIARVAAVALLAALLLIVTPGRAEAHAVLLSTDPVDGTRLGNGPTTVSATFNEQLQPTWPSLTVIGPDDNYWQSGDPQVQGAVVSVAMRPLGPAGSYTVHYRVTSADGHPVSGSWSFVLTTPGTGTPGAAVLGDSGGTIPIWPFAVGAVVLVGAGALWASRRGS